MLNQPYDPKLPYRFVMYARMSTKKQNERSPDQQFATIRETIARAGYPWREVTRYRDDGISGRWMRRRPGFQQLLREVETNLAQVDLIVVDTLERLGRAEKILELRRKLRDHHGVLVVAADNHFADPTGVTGKAINLVENIRSTEEGRIKAHNVRRGKKDTARRRRWPGGNAPFGFRLVHHVDEANPQAKPSSTLEIEPREAAALRRLFEQAAATGEGNIRLARWWNACPEIPDEYKPTTSSTIGRRLENPIAIGVLRWGFHSTGIVDDTRVVRRNQDGPERVEEFCPEVVDRDLFERVQEVRRARHEQAIAQRRRRAQAPEKLIRPQVSGIGLKYILSGLVRCTCQASMRAIPSGRKSKAGQVYVYYTCPRFLDGACGNHRRVREDQLRAAVVARLRDRLFPFDGNPDLLEEFLDMVRAEHRLLQKTDPHSEAVEEERKRTLEQQLDGWAQTLGDPSMPASVRQDIGARYDAAKQELAGLCQRSASREAMIRHLATTISAEEVLRNLANLDQILAGFNPTRTNLELSQHIDAIVCHPDGRIELRGTYLGLLADGAECLRRTTDLASSTSPGSPSPPLDEAGGFAPAVPRRRAALRLPDLTGDADEGVAARDTTLDPRRFAHLPETMRWSEDLDLEKPKYWSEANADLVAQARRQGLTHAELADKFGVTLPTIRKALALAGRRDPTLECLPRKLPRRRWEEDHWEEVARLRAEGRTMKALAAHFGKSEPTLKKALLFGAAQSPRSQGEHPSPT